jgi:hypothetical protein
MTDSTTALAMTGAADADYARLGIARDTIAIWEDGARTDGSPGTYEWWYFDAHLDDGTKLVVVFMNKDMTASQKPLDPLIRINLDLPDGRSFEKLQTFAPETYSAATDHADVRMADNRFEGDLHRYRITAAVDDISVDVTLTGQVPAWRPETGCMLFGADHALEFCWLPAVPQGAVEAKLSIGDETHQASGVGYPAGHHPRLVLGTWPGRTVLDNHLVHHRAQEVRLHGDPDLHARQGWRDRRRRCVKGHIRARGHLHRDDDRQAGCGSHPVHL